MIIHVVHLLSKKHSFRARLVVTVNDSVPIEINSGIVIRRQHMTTTQEEADTISMHQIACVRSSRVLVVTFLIIEMF